MTSPETPPAVITHDGTPEDREDAEQRAAIIEEGCGLPFGTIETRCIKER